MSNATESQVPQLSQPCIYFSRQYFDKIKSSLITKNDLEVLYGILVKKSTESADLQLKLQSNLPGPVKEVFEIFKGKLWVEIWGGSNEYISGDHESVFNDEHFPKKIIRIFFNSYYGYQMAMGDSKMQNLFETQFDFKKNQIIDFSNNVDPASQNNSYFKVQGVDETWADGVYQAINLFLKDKALKRNWLYSSYTYDVLLYLLFFPITFRVSYEIGSFLNISNLIVPLAVAIYIYIFIVFLYVFRTIFNYSKWLFPLIELKNGSPSSRQRTLLFMIVVSIFCGAAWDAIKALPNLLR